MGHLTNASDLINYELKSSNSNNYSSYKRTPGSESFPELMGNGIYMKYEFVRFSTDLIEEKENLRSPYQKV